MPGGVRGKPDSAFDERVSMHRVDTINPFHDPPAPVNLDATGIAVAVLSGTSMPRYCRRAVIDFALAVSMISAPVSSMR